MNEIERDFYKDVQEKKRTARGARSKVNGMNSKKCTLPSDILTRKEMLAMNSEPVKWCLRDFYTWNDFKKMPSDIQVEYLQSLTDKYKVTCTAISTALFQLTDKALYDYLIRHNLYTKVHWHGFKGRKAAAYNAEFERIIEQRRLSIVDRVPDTEEVEEDPVVPEIVHVPAPEIPVIDTDLYKSSPRGCQMESNGFDIELFRYLANRYKDTDCIVGIYVTVKE